MDECLSVICQLLVVKSTLIQYKMVLKENLRGNLLIQAHAVLVKL